MKNQEVCLPSNIKKLKQSEVDHEFYMDFAKYIKPLLRSVHHLYLYFLQLELLVTNLHNEFAVKDSFAFAEEIVHQDSKLFMGSLDVDSLFTNIPLEETINICTNLLYNNEDVIEGINKSEFKNLLSLATQESYFIFIDVLYKQKDGVAMGSPVGPTMANVFLLFYEVKWLEHCPKEFKPVFYRRYVDDIFVLFESAKHLSKFRD